MLENLLMGLLGLQDHRLARHEFIAGAVHLWVEPKPGSFFVCPHCGRAITAIHSRWPVQLKERPILGHPVVLHMERCRLRCICRGELLTVDLPNQEPGFRVSCELANTVHELAREVPLKVVARHLGLSWNTARDIDLARLRGKLERTEPLSPNAIGVDEIAYRRGHKYLTLVNDPLAGRLLFVTEGRKAENLELFFEERMDPVAAKRLEAASIDMWDPYEKAIRKRSVQALIVYDKFHLVRMLNECVDEVRRREQGRLEKEGRQLLKRKRFILLRGQERLKPDQQQTLAQLLAQNEALQTAYLLKEQFRQLYEIEPERGENEAALVRRAFNFLIGWIGRAEASGLSPLRQFARRLKRRWAGVLNYFRYPITNGLAEGLNNKIASLAKRAYGFRNLEYFTLKIYQQGGLI